MAGMGICLEVTVHVDDTQFMLRIGTHSRFLLAALCILAVVLRISGAHLHLCIDSAETPANYHFEGFADLHHEDMGHDAALTHADVDINVLADAIFKMDHTGSSLLQMFSALAAILALLWSDPQRQRPPAYSRTPNDCHRWSLWPPLRGPPAAHT